MKTCDIRYGAESALRGTSHRAAGASGPPSRMGVCAKGPSSIAPHGLGDGRGAPRLYRSLQPCKRPSSSLSKRQAANLAAAARYAVELGAPLNRFVTINWEAAGVVDCAGATGRFLKYASDWLRRRGGHIAYIWVQEGGNRVGQHAHILLHVPADLARRFSELQRRWLGGCGAEFHRGLIKSRPVGRSYRAAFGSDPSIYDGNLRRVLGYLLKEADEVGQPGGQCSLVVGKRCATSQNIGARARAHSIDASVELP